VRAAHSALGAAPPVFLFRSAGPRNNATQEARRGGVPCRGGPIAPLAGAPPLSRRRPSRRAPACQQAPPAPTRLVTVPLVHPRKPSPPPPLPCGSSIAAPAHPCFICSPRRAPPPPAARCAGPSGSNPGPPPSANLQTQLAPPSTPSSRPPSAGHPARPLSAHPARLSDPQAAAQRMGHYSNGAAPALRGSERRGGRPWRCPRGPEGRQLSGEGVVGRRGGRRQGRRAAGGAGRAPHQGRRRRAGPRKKRGGSRAMARGRARPPRSGRRRQPAARGGAWGAAGGWFVGVHGVQGAGGP
jgi:hypothetical protein